MKLRSSIKNIFELIISRREKTYVIYESSAGVVQVQSNERKVNDIRWGGGGGGCTMYLQFYLLIFTHKHTRDRERVRPHAHVQCKTF